MYIIAALAELVSAQVQHVFPEASHHWFKSSSCWLTLQLYAGISPNNLRVLVSCSAGHCPISLPPIMLASVM